jgi:hypothetical protein
VAPPESRAGMDLDGPDIAIDSGRISIVTSGASVGQRVDALGLTGEHGPALLGRTISIRIIWTGPLPEGPLVSREVPCSIEDIFRAARLIAGFTVRLQESPWAVCVSCC